MSRLTVAQLVSMAAAAALLYLLGHSTAASVLAALAAVVLALALGAPGVLRTSQELASRALGFVATATGIALLGVVYGSVFSIGALWLRIRHVDPLDRSFPTQGESNFVDRVGYGDKRLYTKPYTNPHSCGSSGRDTT